MIRFESPWCLLALLIPAALWIWRWYRRRQRAGLRFSTVAHAQKAGRSLRQRISWIPVALGDLGLSLLIIALARPQTGRERIRDVSEGIAIEMILDRSGSMAQELDFEGQTQTRFDVVKEIFRRFVFGDGKQLKGRPNDLIGMIVFARYADTTCPLTLSHGILQPFLDTVNLVQERSEDGTAIGDALALAIARLHTADETLAKQLKKNISDTYQIKSKVAILLTDGETNVGRTVASVTPLAKSCGVRVHVIALGGSGMMVIDTPFGKRRMPIRQQAVNTSELEELARETGGSFRKAASAQELLEIYADIDEMERSQVESIRFVDYKELFQPFALAGLACILIRLLLEATLFRRLP